jgi:hypothetical protein
VSSNQRNPLIQINTDCHAVSTQSLFSILALHASGPTASQYWPAPRHLRLFKTPTNTNILPDFFGRSKTLSEQLRHSRTPNTGAPPNPDNTQGYGGPNSRHTSFLPPYAQVVSHYPNEAKPPSVQEADGGAFAGYGHMPQQSAVSPEMRQADAFGGFSYPDSRPSMQNMNMG